MNAEAQVTVGSELLHRGFSVTEAHGDQPGALAELDQEGAGDRLRADRLRQPQRLPRPRPLPREHALLVSEKQASTLRAVTSYTDGSNSMSGWVEGVEFAGPGR